VSSIYKKKRDGYFYYQAYVFNNKTGKKDKKIYKSLGTKSFDEANTKKQHYDSLLFKSNKIVKFSRYKNRLIIFSSFILFFLVFEYRWKNTEKVPQGYISNINIENDLNNLEELKKNKYNFQGQSSAEKVIEVKVKPKEKITEKKLIQNNNLVDTLKEENVITNYTILKVENINPRFNQAKIFLSVEESSTDKEIEKLCRKIKLEYSQYNNLILCVYSNEEIKNISDGNIYFENYNLLAMYTYNPVEGEYFDGNFKIL